MLMNALFNFFDILGAALSSQMTGRITKHTRLALLMFGVLTAAAYLVERS